MRRSTRLRLLALAVAVALVASACGDDKGDGGTTGQAGSSTTAAPAGTGSATTLTPVKGGILTFGQFSREGGLDPAALAGGGTVGGIENAALYDTIMRLDHASGKYVGRTAESMTPSADFLTWTLKLKSGIKFTDGTDYNADAVKFVQDRELKEGNASVRGQMANFIDSITVTDPLTVTYKLKIGWAGFPYLMSHVPGMIYSPTAFKKAADAKAFSTNPVDAGAGPFKLKSYKPGESIELERNPTYYGGEVYLDGMKFVNLNNPQSTYDALKTNTLQAALMRDPAIYAQSIKDGFGRVDIPQIGGNLLIMNSGIDITCAGAATAGVPLCAGQPDGTKVQTKTATRDLNVRKAVAAAIDPKIVVDKAYQGVGDPNTEPYHLLPVYDPKVPGQKYDPTEAKRLVGVAKAAGWDGKIRLIGGNDATNVAWTQAVAPQLTAVGMDVQASNDTDINGVVAKVLTQRDFDLANWGLAMSDESDGNYTQLLGSFGSTAKRYGYSSPDMDAGIEALRVADTDAKKIAAYKTISEIWIRDAPALVITYIPQAVIHSAKVHGIVRTAQAVSYYDKAWMSK
jgi:peptide/nickel transport system substrate-binding protein